MLRGTLSKAVKWFSGERGKMEERDPPSIRELEAERKFIEEKRRLKSLLDDRERLREEVDSISEKLRQALGTDDEQGQKSKQQKQ